jgi:hypothetical protein
MQPTPEEAMAGKRAALMQQMANQLIRFVDGVHDEGGVRRVAFEFPENAVVVVVMRREEYEAIDSPDSTKAKHKYSEQMMVEPKCSWCGERKNSYLHAGF